MIKRFLGALLLVALSFGAIAPNAGPIVVNGPVYNAAAGGGGGVAFDNFTDLASTTGTSLTASHTASGASRYLLVFTLGDLGSDLITGVTYNGVAMTKLNAVLIPSDRYVSLWGLANPASGSNSVVVSASSSIFIGAVAASYTGVSSLETSTTNTTSGVGSITGTVTTTAANCWTVAGFGNDGGVASAGTGTTTRGSGSLGGLSFMDSNLALSSGSHTLQATQGSNPNWAVIIASLAP